MLSIDNLKTFGANTAEGLKRCVNKEDFYLRMVNSSLKGDQMEQLAAAISDKNWEKAFETAHTLKGVFGNLALTPLYDPMCQLTDQLRAKTETDCTALLLQCQSKWTELKKLAE